MKWPFEVIHFKRTYMGTSCVYFQRVPWLLITETSIPVTIHFLQIFHVMEASSLLLCLKASVTSTKSIAERRSDRKASVNGYPPFWIDRNFISMYFDTYYIFYSYMFYSIEGIPQYSDRHLIKYFVGQNIDANPIQRTKRVKKRFRSYSCYFMEFLWKFYKLSEKGGFNPGQSLWCMSYSISSNPRQLAGSKKG